MYSLLALLPLASMVVLYAVLTKLAAKAYRNSVLPWKHAFAFSVLAIVAGTIGMALRHAAGPAIGPAMALALGLAMSLALGGWYLGPRVKTSSGEPVASKGGVLVAAIGQGFVLLLAVTSAVLIPMAYRGGHG
jgi:hypothetical protein